MRGILKNKKARTVLKLMAVVVTIGIIAMLFMVAPANALSISMWADKQSVKAGDIVNFNINLNVASDQQSSVNKISVMVSGPIVRECSFDLDGNKLATSSCIGFSNISVSKSQSTTGYGYLGYGYGYQTQENNAYHVSFDTTSLPSGSYLTILSVNGVQVGQNGVLNIKSTISDSGIIFGSTSTTTQTSDATNKELYVQSGDAFNLISDSEFSQMTINNVNPTSLDLSVDGNSYNIGVGDQKSIDTNKDGKTDLSVNVLFIGDNRASIAVNSPNFMLSPTVVSTSSIRPNVQNTKSLVYSQFAQTNSGFDLSSLNLSSNLITTTILIIANLIMIELIAMTYVIKKRKVRKVRRVKRA